MIALSLGILTGCKGGDELSVEDLNENISILAANLDEKEEELDTLRRLLATYNPNLSEVQGLSNYVTLANGDEAYLSLRDRINVLNPIEVQPSTIIQNETVIYLNNSIQFKPNANWIVQTGSGKLKMNHTNGVYAEVETYEYIGKANGVTGHTEFISPHLEAIKAEKVGGTRLIFLSDGEQAGTQVTSRLKVATLNNLEKHVFSEEMTKPYEDITEAEVIDTSETGTEVNNTETETNTVETEANNTETGASIETEAETEVETVTQKEDDIYSVDNYIYTCGTAIYNEDSGKSDVIVFKFFYKEGDAADVASKAEFVDNTIKSFAINGNYLTLQ